MFLKIQIKLLLSLGLGAQALSNQTQARIATACAAVRQAFPVEQVDSWPLNETIVEESWSLSCVKEPYCIILPNSAEDVAVALGIIRSFKVTFATRSGGHSPNPGWSSVGTEGILIDLQKLDQVTLSTDNKIASIGPGARWGQVQNVANEKNVSIVGARLPDVGVGGLLLGGGYFYFTAEYGLAADNVKNYEIALSNGTVTNANKSVNEDLFWALKGGGPNFGIVTRFDIYTIPVNVIWYEVLIYPTSQALDALDALAQWQLQGGSSDTKSSVVFVITFNYIELALVYTEPQSERPDCFAPFSKLEFPDTLVAPTNGTLTDLYKIAGSGSSPLGERHDYRAASSLVDAQLYKDVYSYWLEQAQTVYGSTGANQTFAIQFVPSSVAAYGNNHGGNPIGIPEVAHQWWTTLVDWDNAADDDLVRSVAINTTSYWEQLSEERDLNTSVLYMNDAARDQSPISSYGSESIQRLQEVAWKYDPLQLFQVLQNDGFLLNKL